jgi:hypothetical protein
MSSQKKPTLSKVARLAKTSSATVDRVLKNRRGVSKKLENRVLNAAKLLMLDRNLERITKPLLRFSVLMNRPGKDIYARAQKAILDHQENNPSKQFVCNFLFFRARIHKISWPEFRLLSMVLTVQSLLLTITPWSQMRYGYWGEKYLW